MSSKPNNQVVSNSHLTQVRLPPEVNRIVYVRNLPFKISPKDLYDIFGKYGTIRQIRKGINNETRGSAFVIYDDVFDAKEAVTKLNGFQVSGRYLILQYFQPQKAAERQAVLAEQRKSQMAGRFYRS